MSPLILILRQLFGDDSAPSTADFRRRLRVERERCDRNGSQLAVVRIRVPSGTRARTKLRMTRILVRRLRIVDGWTWLENDMAAVLLSNCDREAANVVAERFTAQCEQIGVRVETEIDLYPEEGTNGTPRWEDVPTFSLVESLLASPPTAIKRAMDITVSLLGIVCLSPLILLLMVGIRVTSPGPIFFLQPRRGYLGQSFRMWKFRSMIVGAEARQADLRVKNQVDGPAFKMKDDPRVTWLGRLMRSTSLDELPQLFHVLSGKMSLVGPRPLPLREADGCAPWQRPRMEVVPGLTCIWQVSGRSNVAFEEWMRMDRRYLPGRSLCRDLLLLVRTVPAVLTRRGAV